MKAMSPKNQQARAVAKVHAKWDTLRTLIAEYAVAAVAESWKGGGDPADVDTLTLACELARAKLNAHIEKMERDQD